MTARTIATIRPRGGPAHNDVREIQVREEAGGITVWQWTSRGPVLLRDRGMLAQLVQALAEAGFGGPAPEQQELRVREAARAAGQPEHDDQEVLG